MAVEQWRPDRGQPAQRHSVRNIHLTKGEAYSNPSSGQGGRYIRTTPESVQFHKKILTVILKGLVAKTN
jgi:hypothetical protein